MTITAAQQNFRTLDEIREEGMDPHARLMLAVLEDALVSYQAGLLSACPQRRRRSHEAAAWLRSREFDSLFSFENVCAVLELDPDYIRAGLEKLRHRAQRSPVRLPVRRSRRPNAGQLNRSSSMSGMV